VISFKGSHFPKEVIMQSIRWYTSYSLSYRDVEELLEERGVELDHATVNRWVVKYSPLLELKFRKRKKKTGSSWRMDETYIKIKSRWVYYYRAVDTDNQTIDFYLSEKRDAEAARNFFTKAIDSSGLPDKVNIDKSGANLAGLQAINQDLPEDERIMVRQIK
jgi:putative transposase